MTNASLSRDIEFIYEIGCMRHIQRAWKQFYGANFQNDTEHTFRVIWIALIIAQHEGVSNTEKIVKMGLVHDLSESRTGDVHYVSREYTKRNEKQAVKDVFDNTSIQDEFISLWNEYHERKTIESKIVKDADNLDVDFEIREQNVQGHEFERVWKKKREQVMSEALYTKTAKNMWNEIYSSDPHSWHMNAMNRFTKGDWKKD